MAVTPQGRQATVSVYPSCGRGFAIVDPERQREVEITLRMPSPMPARVRRVPVEWFSPPRAPSEEGGSSRRKR